MGSSIQSGNRNPQQQAQQQQQQQADGAELKRGQRTLRQADAKVLGRGNSHSSAKADGEKKGGIKQFVKGAKMGITGSLQTAAYTRLARAALGHASMDKAEAKSFKTSAKAQDGRALMLSALRGTKVDAQTAKSVQARDARHAEKKAEKAAKLATAIARRENNG